MTYLKVDGILVGQNLINLENTFRTRGDAKVNGIELPRGRIGSDEFCR